MAKVMVLVGTSKGGFIFNSNSARKNWQVSDILFKSWGVMHMQMDQRDQRLHAAVNHIIYGSTTHYSDDLGKTWTQAAGVPVLGRASKSGRPLSTPEEAGRSAEGEDVQAKPEKFNQSLEHHPWPRRRTGGALCRGRTRLAFQVHRPGRELDAQ